MTQIARPRQPGAAAIAFMNTDVPTAATFRNRARTARRPCSASAMPRQANTSAAASGIAASRPAMTGSRRAASTIRYWAEKLTAAAAPASSTSPAAAPRSHPPDCPPWPATDARRWPAAGQLRGAAGSG